MRVLIEGQREMSERIGGVARLLERAQHQVGDDALLGLARDFFGQALVVLRANGDVERREAKRSSACSRGLTAPLCALRPRAAIGAATPIGPGDMHIAVLHHHQALGKIFHPSV
jgi:hypothetical protein